MAPAGGGGGGKEGGRARGAGPPLVGGGEGNGGGSTRERGFVCAGQNAAQTARGCEAAFERIVRWSPRHCRDVLLGSRSLLGKNICSTSLWMRTSHASARAARSRKCAASASASLTRSSDARS